jgi:phosphotransacetylase
MLTSPPMVDRFLEKIQDRARARRLRIVLPESTEPRTLLAALEMKSRGIAEPVLVGEPDDIREAARSAGIPRERIDAIEIHSPRSRADAYGRRLHRLARHRGLSEDEARKQALDPLYFGALMVEAGDAAGYVAGARNSTANVLRPALRVFGTEDGIHKVSSFFLMSFPTNGPVHLADCAVIRAHFDGAGRDRAARRLQHPSISGDRAESGAPLVLDERERRPPADAEGGRGGGDFEGALSLARRGR